MKLDFDYKTSLLVYCKDLVHSRLSEIQTVIDAKKNDLNSATKSSAGDKHETARAMIHLEQEKLGIQFQEVKKQFQILSQIKLTEHKKVQMGTLIQTDKALFFISVALGKVRHRNYDCFVISPISPLGQKFLNACAGDTIELNSAKYVVSQVI